MDTERSRLQAVREHVPKLGQLGVAVLLHEAGDVVAAAPAAGLTLDREGRDEEVREGLGVVSHGWRAGGLLELGSDFYDRDTFDPGVLDWPDQEPLRRVLDSLLEMLLVVLHRLASDAKRRRELRRNWPHRKRPATTNRARHYHAR
jgi:hypothetical protein